LQRTVALYSEEAATHVHWGSTSQDVLDTAMVLVTREALLVDGELDPGAPPAGTGAAIWTRRCWRAR
jgi:hypothetical protein